MKVSEKKRGRVIEVRRSAVAAVSKHGAFEDIGCMKVLSCRIGDIKISFRTPFQKIPDHKAVSGYDEAVAMRDSVGSLGYGLDVWAGNRKVMNVEWQDDEMRVSAYKPGDWEALVAAA